MNDRATTNVLLAIIAGVLLFGQTAMTGALQVGAIALAVLVVLALVVSGILAFINSAAEEWRAGATRRDRLESAAGYAMMPFGAAFGLTVGWFWLQGVSKPLEAAMWTPFGIAWMIVLVILMTGFVRAGLWNVGRKAFANRAQAPSRIADAVLYYFIALVAVVALPVREWRSRRALRLNVFWAAGNAFIVMMVGFMISLATIGFSLLVGAVLVGAIPLATIMQ